MKNHRSLRVIVYLLVLPLFLSLGFAAGVAVDRFLITPTIASAQAPPDSSKLPLLNEALQTIQQNYVDQSAVQLDQLQYGAISGMVDALGDTGHSRFLTPQMVKEEENFNQGSFEGIGAEVTMKDGQVVIVSPIDGSPAQAAGVKPGDIIVKVNGEDVTGQSISEVVSKVLGPAGTQVMITLQNPETGRNRDVTITRAKIDIQNVTWNMLPGSTIAHVRIAAFSQNVTRDLQDALKQIQAQGASGIILDLRNDPGGLLNEAVGVTSQFLSSGDALRVRDAQGKEKAYPVKPGGQALDIPVVVLINQGTASAAEIVAGALQDAHRATLVGETTFGTGTVLYPFRLSDGSEVLLATEEWLTPSGRLIWHQGIQPDETVALPSEVQPLMPRLEQTMTMAELQASKDAQVQRAIEILSAAK